MKILEIKLSNWCQYQGEHNFSFADGPDKNIVLIHADNGIGKSSLFYSIAWCFYETALPDKWVKNDWPLYPLPWLQRANEGELLKTEVEVIYEHGGINFSAARSFITQKKQNQATILTRSFTFMRREIDGNWVNEEAAILHETLPPSVLGYFVFDAEKIEHFVNQSEKVKDFVRKLLDINEAEKAIAHLDNVQIDLMREINRGLTNQAKVLKDEVEALDRNVVQLKENLDNPQNGLRAKHKQFRSEKDAVENVILTYKDQYSLIAEQKKIEDEIDKIRQGIVDDHVKLKNLTQRMYLPLIFPVAQRSLQFLNDKKQKGELPKDIKKRFVNDRINLKKCICGTDLSPGSKPFAIISEFRDTLSDELSDIAQNLSDSLIVIQEKTKELKKRLADLLKHLSDKKNMLDQKNSELRTVRSKIQEIKDMPDIPQLQIKKEQLENEIESIVRTITKIQLQYDEEFKKLNDAKQRLEKELSRQAEIDETSKMWQLANIVSAALNKTLEDYKSKARDFLEQQCNKTAKELFWREDVFTIHINEDYVLSVTSRETNESINLLPGMSMGETHVAGLSLIAALARQTQAKAPLIMDTPFARLGPAHITKALSECPKYFEQWILFLQPSEWQNNNYRKIAGRKIQKEYTLKRDNITGITTAEEGYHPEYFGKMVE